MPINVPGPVGIGVVLDSDPYYFGSEKLGDVDYVPYVSDTLNLTDIEFALVDIHGRKHYTAMQRAITYAPAFSGYIPDVTINSPGPVIALTAPSDGVIRCEAQAVDMYVNGVLVHSGGMTDQGEDASWPFSLFKDDIVAVNYSSSQWFRWRFMPDIYPIVP